VEPQADGKPDSKGFGAFQAVITNPFFLFLLDLFVAGLAYSLAWLVRMLIALPFTQDLLPQERWDAVPHPWLVLILSQGFLLYVLGLYDDLRVLRIREIMAYAFTACTLQVITITSLFYLTNEVFPRTVILIFGFCNFLGLCAWRIWVKRRLQKRVCRVLVVGESLDSTVDIVREIGRNPWMGLRIVGVAVDEGRETESQLDLPILGDLSQTKEIVARHKVEEIIFASHETWKDRVLDSISQLQAERPLRIAILPSVYEIAIGRLRHLNIHDTPLIEVRRNPNEPLERFLKRSLDLVMSGLALLIVLPLFLVVSVAIVILSPGTVFYLQERVGRGGRLFRLVKFRTMIPDAERHSGEVYAQDGDPRITRIGALLRRFRIDELPQLFNVFKGDMSFVGPRPERPGFVRLFASTLPGYHERHKVKPGITGLAQVRGYYDTVAGKKLKYDLAYIYNQSFSLDLLILLETIKVVLIRKGS
jgi:exopolysaccharide biosynthesis polyprenyl glycosylphosphotransferase